MTEPPRPFVLLDRDGTVIEERHYLADPGGVALLPNAAAGLRAMRALGCGLVLVTNQSGVGRGYFSIETLNAIHARLADLLRAEGVTLDGVYFCPHRPADDCACRKPRPGMIRQAAQDHGFDPAHSIVIGDKPCDIELGRAAGTQTLLVRTGYGQRHEAAGDCAPDAVVADLLDAARWIETALRARSFPPAPLPPDAG